MSERARASLARSEQSIRTLRDCYICEGWELDEEAAERALKYFRRVAQPGPRDENRDFQFVIAFLDDHGLSSDWIFRGDVSSLIAQGAAHSPRATRHLAAQASKALSSTL